MVNYVAFSPLSQLTFDPDLIVFMIETEQGGNPVARDNLFHR